MSIERIVFRIVISCFVCTEITGSHLDIRNLRQPNGRWHQLRPAPGTSRCEEVSPPDAFANYPDGGSASFVGSGWSFFGLINDRQIKTIGVGWAKAHLRRADQINA
jgi:hypothetical protein